MSPITKIILIASMLYFLIGGAYLCNAQQTECDGEDSISIDQYGRYQLCWKKNTQPDATKYTVSQSTVSGQEGDEIVTVLQDECEEYICKSPPLDAPGLGTYYYTVYAHDSMGRRSDPSNEVSMTVLNYPPTSPADYIIYTDEGQS